MFQASGSNTVDSSVAIHLEDTSAKVQSARSSVKVTSSSNGAITLTPGVVWAAGTVTSDAMYITATIY